MKNDITYEYRVFTNRLIDVEAMEVGKCTSKVVKELKPKDKVNGRFFHTSDTDEWFFCWNNELQKLNLKGDSDVNAALAEVEKLIADANAAVSEAQATAKDAKDAADAAQIAADAASAAVESIEGKADKSEVDALAIEVATKANANDVEKLVENIDKKADIEIVENLSQTVEEKADKSVVKELSDKVDAIKFDDYALKSEIPSIDGLATESFVSGEIAKIEIPAVPTKVSELENDANYLTEHQDITGKQDKIEDLDTIRSLANSALQEVPAEYVTETELESKGYLTSEDADLKYAPIGSEGVDLSSYATKEYVGEEIAKIEIPVVPTNVSAFVNDANYLTEHQDITGKQDIIEDLATIRSGAALGTTALQEVPAEYVTETELESKGYLTSQSLEEYALKSEIPSLDGYAKTEDIPTIPPLDDYALKSEIPSMDNYYTKDDIDSKFEIINALLGEANEYITNTILA